MTQAKMLKLIKTNNKSCEKIWQGLHGKRRRKKIGDQEKLKCELVVKDE